MSNSGASGIAAVSSSDNVLYGLTVDHKRALLTDDPAREYMMAQLGRQLFRDDFEAPVLKWGQAVATVALDSASSALKGSQSMKLTTAAGPAGTTAVAQKFHGVPADQGFSTQPQVIMEFWFRPNDANWRDIQAFIRPDDTVQRWEGAVRFNRQNAGVASYAVQYLDGNGNFQTLTTWNIQDGSGAASDPWHHVMLVMNYKNGLNGAGGYFNYALVKFDDYTAKVFNISGTGNAGHAVASNAQRTCQTSILVTCDAALAASINVDEFEFCDLSATRQL